MINNTVRFVRDRANEYLRSYLALPDGEERIVLSNLVDNSDSEGDDIPHDRVLLSLIHIEEERIFKSQETTIRRKDTAYRANPDLKFNLYISFAANYTFSNYEEGLKSLSGIITCFQGKNVFEPATFSELDKRIERLVVDLYTPSMEQASQMWQAMGGKFLPSVLFKLRLVMVMDDRPHFPTPFIQGLEIDTRP